MNRIDKNIKIIHLIVFRIDRMSYSVEKVYLFENLFFQTSNQRLIFVTFYF